MQSAEHPSDLPDGSLIGRTIGTYRLVRELGKGGMGTVYEAVHEHIGQRAAVKVLDPLLSTTPKQVDRFFDEARAISMVPHPGLVKLFDFNRLPDGTIYIMMEYLEGESLWARFVRLRQQGRWLTLAEALRITRQMASAVSAVHDKGIIHRDLKPENVIIVPDPEAAGGERAKILDFGIAKIAEQKGTRRTTVGTTLGTPYYMSPEQCKGAEDLTDRSDVYSLGVLLYEMIAGHPPFHHEQGSLIMAAHIFRPVPPLQMVLPAPPPPEVCQLVEEMLAKEPPRRPPMRDIVARLGRIGAAGQVPEFEPSQIMTPPPGSLRLVVAQTTKRRPVFRTGPAAAVAVAVLILVALLGVVWRMRRPAPVPAPVPVIDPPRPEPVVPPPADPPQPAQQQVQPEVEEPAQRRPARPGKRRGKGERHRGKGGPKVELFD